MQRGGRPSLSVLFQIKSFQPTLAVLVNVIDHPRSPFFSL
jgi:hypothetical protein